MKKTSAYLSIFMSLTLTVMISLCLVFIEGTRQNTIRLKAECVTDIGINSVLAEYHREVLKRYNLFFIDSSYGTEYPSYSITEEHLKTYIEKNISSGIYMDMLALTVPQVKIAGVSLATDNSGYNFQKQAVQAAASDIGIGVLDEISDWIKVVEEENLLENKMEEEINALEQKLYSLKGKRKQEDSSWIYVEMDNPVEEITGPRKNGLLSWVAGRIADLSDKVIDPSQYISDRRKNHQMNQGNLPCSGNLSFYERLLFQDYLFQYAGNYGDVREGSQLDYQIEYLLFGDSSDAENLIKTAAAICGVRETANLISLMADAQKQEWISAAAALLSAALFAPEAAPVIEGLIVIAWSCLESIQDTRILLEGGSVPLIKDAESWNVSLENVLDKTAADNKKSEGIGLSYEDYLRVYMYFADLEEVTYRFMDIMEMDVRATEGNEHFRIDGCMDYLEIAVTFESAYGYQYKLKHAKGYR